MWGTPMTIIHAIMLAMAPSMTLLAVLLCRPAFRRKSETRPNFAIRARTAKRGVYRSYPGFAGIVMAGRSNAAKGGGEGPSIHGR